MRRKTTFLSVLFLALLLCSGPVRAQEPKRIMVMPVMAKSGEAERHLPDFTARVREYFANAPRIILLDDDQLGSLLGNATGPGQEMVQVAGEKLGCSGALLITLARYRERLGDEYSATDPASLAFEYQLVNVADGKVVCFGQFDETQRPLSENILELGQAIKRHFKWITVADLAREALNRKFSSCPGLAAPEN